MKFNTLNSLTLSCCTLKKPVLDVIGNMTTLKYLDLSKSWLEPESNFFEASNLDNLEHLNVRSLDADDDFLIAVVAKCTKLVHLNAANMLALTTRESFVEIGKLKMLKHLDLSDNDEVDDTIINQFQDLQVLCCFKCEYVSDASIIRILKNSPSLKDLNVIDTGISTETIRCAVDVTLTRANGIILKLSVPYGIKQTFLRMNNNRNVSRFLKVRA